jgi:hypothetical protein
VGGERRWRKGMGGWMWCKYCAHMYANGKMVPVETVPWMVCGGDKGEWWGVNSIYQYIWYKNICKCHNVSPPSTIKNMKK